MRNICTLHCWRVEMKCWTQSWNTKWDRIGTQRLGYWHQVSWYGLHHLRYVVNKYRNMPLTVVISLFSLFWKNKVGYWHHVAVCVCVCVSAYPPIVARQRLGKNHPIVARQRLGKYLLIVTRQRPGRNVTAVTNTHATIEELLDASFSMWPV
jgi:hypothetical protein